ncbi:MAG: GIY-YIG nuclease family protein [Patescibacteria group bacterium]
MYCVYVLQSRKNRGLYIGFSNDLRKRFKRHNLGMVISTKLRRPFDIIYYEACLNKTDALHREIYLKTAWGRRYINNRMKNYNATIG